MGLAIYNIKIATSSQYLLKIQTTQALPVRQRREAERWNRGCTRRRIFSITAARVVLPHSFRRHGCGR
jgi:hypothetical protein